MLWRIFRNTMVTLLIIFTIIILILLYLFYPILSNNNFYDSKKYEGIIDNEYYYDGFLDNIVIQDFTNQHPLIEEFVKMKYGSYTLLGTYEHNRKLLRIFSKSDEQVFFHEYLHHLYYKAELTDKEIEKLDAKLLKVPGTKLNGVINNMYFDENITESMNNSITETIAYSYDQYYNSNNCKKWRDHLTDELIELGLLPNKIYCKGADFKG